MNEEFLTVRELAKCSNESVAVWRKRVFFRQIGYVKCGKNVRVSKAELNRWLSARTVVAQAPSL